MKIDEKSEVSLPLGDGGHIQKVVGNYNREV